MASWDFTLTVLGIVYGIVLIASAFINNRFLESFRLDAMFMSNPSPKTRPVNLLAGLVFIGYNVYTWVL